MYSNYEAAKQYLKNHWSIIPAGTKSKVPLIAWTDYQTRFPTENEVKEWFDGTENNIALVTGKISNLIVLDTEAGCDLASLDLPPTLISKSGGGGYHYFYKYPEGKEIGNIQAIKPKCDLKGDGGLITVPPSIHPNGNKYFWDLKNPNYHFALADCPKWIINEASNTAGRVDWSILDGVAVGGRNCSAAQIIGKIICSLKTEDWNVVAWPLIEAWNYRNSPPLPLHELKETWKSVTLLELKKRQNVKEKCALNKTGSEPPNTNTTATRETTAAVFTRIGQAEAYLKSHPIYYSPEGIFWVWNHERYCYEMKDVTDLLNGIRDEMNLDTIDAKTRIEIIEALKQVGRQNAPKEKPKGWIQFKDTLVNPRNMEKTAATSEYFLTNPIPWSIGTFEETPTITKLLNEWVVRDDVQDLSYSQSLLEFIAYAITDDKFMQRIIALTGGGSNGKGTFLKLIENLVGKENCCSISIKNLSYNNFATSAIYRKLVAFAGEVAYTDLRNTNILKLLTGEDLIRYEFKGKTPFTAESITTIFVATNSLPTTPDRSLGFYRRWVIVDFPNVFNINPDVLALIPNWEYENLCLKCCNILQNLYKTRKFTNEGTYEEREAKYEERSNPLPSFIEENCDEVIGEMISLREFSTCFNAWLKTKRLRLVNVREVGGMLRRDGWRIGKRSLDDPTTSEVVIIALTWKKNTENTENTEKLY